MDPEALQQHVNYGIKAILDRQNEGIIERLHRVCTAPSGTFDEPAVLRLILYPDTWNTALSTVAQTNVRLTQLLRRAAHVDIPVGRDYADLVYEMCQLIVSTDGRATVALGVSHDMLKRMKIATGGIDPDTSRFSEVAAVRAALEKMEATRLRSASPSTLAAALTTDWFDLLPDYYRIFVGPQEPDGRVRDSDQCSQAHMLGLLVEQLFCMSNSTGSTSEAAAFRALVGQKSSAVAVEFPGKLRRLMEVLAGVAPHVVFRMVLETLAGKQWYFENAGNCLTNYLWDSSTLAKARKQFDRVSIDPAGAKVSGSYLRMFIAWAFVAVGVAISIAAGVVNWGGRTSKFERINDTFQTFLLFLAVPAFTVKIMSHSGEQAIKDWLTGCVRIANMEQIEKIVLNRLVRRHRIPEARAVLAINRVKCETDKSYNWASPDNLCFKPGHKDGQISAMKARSTAELECVIGIDGEIARSWIAPNTTSYIYGADMNHLTFSCGGGAGPELKGLFVAQYPLHGAFFA